MFQREKGALSCCQQSQVPVDTRVHLQQNIIITFIENK